jgi:hypothetical protein
MSAARLSPRAWLRSTVDAIAPVRQIPIDRCYHFRGFRYGGFGNNPYEDYIVGLSRQEERASLRWVFAQRMLSCRPNRLGLALQIDIVDWPLWAYPWRRRKGRTGWEVADPKDNPDIVTYFCAAGVLASHINREFGWLDNAWNRIRDQGYRPREFGHVTCLELVGDSASSYIVLDGNHRLSALHATGAVDVEARVSPLRRVRRSAASRWPRVRDGSMSLADALVVFDRYFLERNLPMLALNPARLLLDQAPLWPVERVDA